MPYTSSPGCEARDVPADRPDRPGDVRPGTGVFGARSPKPASRIGYGMPGHQVPGAPVDAGGAHADQHLVVADRGPGDLLASRSTSSGAVP